MNQTPELVMFLGRLHLVLLHLPIGFILLLALLELLSLRPQFRQANAPAGYILALAVPAAALTAAFGWMLALDGGYDGQLLQVHRITGLASAILCLLAATLYWLNWKKSYRLLLAACALGVIVAGHLGGQLTHGKNFLTEYAPRFMRPHQTKVAGFQVTPTSTPRLEEREVFASVVQPILRKKCLACHDAEKHKAGLRLDTFENLTKGSKNGPVIVPGDVSRSILMTRVSLPIDDEERMPPSSQPPLTASELALLRWWVESGTPAAKTIRELNRPPEIQRILEENVPNTARRPTAD